ncbi:MAG: DUF4296 domain-containing protein [Bacteroidia bacterium]|nr:DUF4296 domain-containing protein [Bacteroidia bacterium]
MDVNLKRYLQKLYYIAIAFVMLIIIASCHKNETAPTPSIRPIGVDTIVKVLADIHLIEASVNIRFIEDYKKQETRNTLKSKIYKQYGITALKFKESYDYYSENPILLDSIYTEVITEITQRELKTIK